MNYDFWVMTINSHIGEMIVKYIQNNWIIWIEHIDL